jgi:hypothetical protein
MDACLYGHPASGHLFVNEVQDYLASKGWDCIGRADARTLFKRGDVILCIYVDDVKAAGPPAELAQLWEELRGRFVFPDAEATRAFLGQQVDLYSDGDLRVLDISMKAYCESIMVTWKRLWPGVKPVMSRVPIAENLRAYSEEDKRPPERRVQKLIGMILWLARSCRPDLSFAASSLGCRVNSWTDVCAHELARCVAYIEATSNFALRQTWRKGEKPLLRLYTDSDWRQPRSQAGYLLVAESAEDETSRVVIAYGSRKEALCADSVAGAESIAAHLGVRQCLPLFWGISRALLAKFAGTMAPWTSCPLDLLVDNAQFIAIARNGHSENLELLHKAIGVRMGAIKDWITLGWIKVAKVPTSANKANIFTKVESRFQFEGERTALNVVPRSLVAHLAHLQALWLGFNARAMF